MSDPRSVEEGVPEGAVGKVGGEFFVPGVTPLVTRVEPPITDDEESVPLDDLDLDPEEDEDPAADNLADLDEENQYGNL